MQRLAVIGLWLLATTATTVVADFAVHAADAEVTNRPLSNVTGSNATTSDTNSSTTFPRPTGISVPDTTDRTEVPSTTTPRFPSTTGPISTSSATVAPATTLSARWQQTTMTSVGGLVIVSYRPGEVRLESLAPHPGFVYEVKEEGPPEVRVEFKSADFKVEIRAEWDGGLVTEVHEDS